MKKFLCVLVAISLLFVACVPAFAGTNVDALSDNMQKEVASLILSSIEGGSDPETILGRNAIAASVVNGIADFAPYLAAYNASSASTSATVSMAVSAVKSDREALGEGFSSKASTMLTTVITNKLVEKIAPTTTTTASSGESSTEGQTAGDNLVYIVDFLSSLQYDQIEKVVVSLVGNGVITADQANTVANSLYYNQKITDEQRTALKAAIASDEASTNAVDNFFKGYTPTDLSQLFRGFGDSIGQMTAALATLFRSGSSSGNGSSSGSGSSGSNPTDIPATGDYAIPAVAGIALAAGLALVLTKKRKDS